MEQPTERKLAAILKADVIGYSRLLGEDEGATVRTLKGPQYSSSVTGSADAEGGVFSMIADMRPLRSVLPPIKAISHSR